MSAVLSARVVLPVHLELAVRVLVIVLIRRPAERDHAVADLGDGLVAAHQRLLVVAGLRLRVGAVRDRAAVGQDHEIFALDAGLHVVAVARGVGDHALEHLARVLRHRLAVHHEIAGDPRDLRLPGKLDRGVEISHHEDVGMRRRHVEPHREARESCAGFRHRVDRGRRHDLGAHGAEQVDERDQEILDAVLLRISPKRRHRCSPLRVIPDCAAIRHLPPRPAAGPALKAHRTSLPGIQFVPASGTCAIAADSIVSATRSSGSRLCRCDLPQARAIVCASSVSTER